MMEIVNKQLLQLYTETTSFELNRPFPSCLVPLFQSESWCVAFHMKMSFHSHADNTHFHMKGFARGLALKKRHKTIGFFRYIKIQLGSEA